MQLRSLSEKESSAAATRGRRSRSEIKSWPMSWPVDLYSGALVFVFSFSILLLDIIRSVAFVTKDALGVDAPYFVCLHVPWSQNMLYFGRSVCHTIHFGCCASQIPSWRYLLTAFTCPHGWETTPVYVSFWACSGYDSFFFTTLDFAQLSSSQRATGKNHDGRTLPT